ncbi:MAG: hypothetical protein V1808_01715 [Candidatus Daviesbacteria bacterium]
MVEDQKEIIFLSPKEYGKMAKNLTRVGIIDSRDDYLCAFTFQKEAEEALSRRKCIEGLVKQGIELEGDFLVMHRAHSKDELFGIVIGMVSRRATVYKRK